MKSLRLLTLAALVAVPQGPQASALVARGIVALHHFEYEDANDAFRQAREADPSNALAFWGEAMTYHQTLWRNEDVAAGRAALARLAPTPEARAVKADSARTRALLTAVDELFGSGDADTRRRRYADAMASAYEQFRNDPDVAALYALALLGTMSRGLIGNMSPVMANDIHDRALAGSATQQRVAAILLEALRAHPQHPGALHYLIHAYDDPDHARLALGAARAYAAIAPDSSHARHMPAHVFLQLGFWREAAAADRAAYGVSKDWVRRKNLGPAMRNYHALSWLQYELLQLGRYREARSLVDELQWAVDAKGPAALLSDWASMRARFAIETRDWSMLAHDTTFANVNDLFAIGVSAARTGDPSRAETVRRTLAERAQAEQEGDLRPAIAIMERELAAAIDLAAGRRSEALAALRSAADAELALPAPLGLPAPIKPAPEMLGEALLDAGRPQEAARAFEQTLRLHANRSLSTLGLARTAVAQGHAADAKTHYRRLLDNFAGADASLPEVKEARAALGSAARQ
ncbi:MAG TPA: tetratricopeptide repeat protein [Vicinamibacterales bacterium]|nr:tetratricopeptide repeat protein [Vicinamibacterales bacterium]